MKPKTFTRLLAAGALAGIGAIHLLPRSYLPFGSRLFAAALVIGTLVMVHRNPLKVLGRDTSRTLESRGKKLAEQTER
jgi:hypothetical protein